MAVNSQEYFKEHALQLGLTSQVVERLAGKGWNCLGNLAHASTTVSSFDADVLQPILGSQDGADADGKNHPLAAALRRFHFEAHQMSMMQLKKVVEASEELAPRRLTQPERESQRDTFNAKSLGQGATMDPALVRLHSVTCPGNG